MRFARRFYNQHSGPPGFGGRRAIAAIELALCLPILMVLTLGMIESCNIVHLRTRMYSAAYESARLATRPATAENAAATASAVTSYGNALLAQLGVQGGQVSLQPSDLSNVVPQQMVTVTVSAPLAKNTATSFVVNNSQSITAQVTLVVE